LDVERVLSPLGGQEEARSEADDTDDCENDHRGGIGPVREAGDEDGAEDRSHAERALEAFVNDFAKWPKAVAKLTKDREAILAFYDFPAEHWIHLRTSNPIESTFSPVRARTDVTKGAGSREAGLAMCFKLIEVALVRAGAKFVNGRLVERTDREDAA
jgi:Transposase, Mutator family